MKRYALKSPRLRKDGSTWWQSVGSMFEKDGGDFTILLDALPLPDAEGRVVVKAYLPKEQASQSATAAPNEDIPF